jgi:hypothetical protein
LEAEAECLRDEIKTKEAIIKSKESIKGSLQSAIEDETNEHKVVLGKMTRQLDD